MKRLTEFERATPFEFSEVIPMDLFYFIIALAGFAGSLCTIAGFVLKVIDRRKEHSHSNNSQK